MVNHHITTTTGYELSCGLQFATIVPAQKCILKNATQYDLDTFGVAGIPEGALLEIHEPEFQKFDENGFLVIQKAHNLTFSKGIVKRIVFQSSTLVSLKVLNSWLVALEVAEEDNFSLKSLTIRSDKYRIISPTFRYLKSLEELTFQKCSLEFIDFNKLAEIEKLRVLDLSWNKIHFVRLDITMPMRTLQSLDVSNNQLKEMPNFPDALPSLKAVSLKRNAWYCDWVSEARGNIWTGGITVMGAETFCDYYNNRERMTNNGGLCCRERPKNSLHSTVSGVVQGILSAVHHPTKKSTQPTIVYLDEEDNRGQPTVLVYKADQE